MNGPRSVAFLVQDGIFSETGLTSGEFLENAPRGAYTTARTVNRKSVFEFEFHVSRLAQSVDLMIKADNKSVDDNWHSCIREAGTLRPIIVDSLRQGLTNYRAGNPEFEGELKITALLTWDENKHHLSVHLSPLPPRPPPPVKVEVRGAPRVNAAAKDSEWVRQRKALEDTKPSDVNEILLVSEDGSLLEGMSSNFFAVQDGKVITAKEGILLGTVREVALNACRSHGVVVDLRPPNLSEVDSWEGAFISSTSRLVLPVDEMILHGSDGTKNVVKFSSSLVTEVAKWVQDDVEKNSSCIL